MARPPPASLKSVTEEMRKRLNEKDWKGVAELLKGNRKLQNLYAHGRVTLIQGAIKDGNDGLVEEMLKLDDLRLDDALLHAVDKGNRSMVGSIMETMKRRNIPADAPFAQSIHFKFYMTPLMLACLKEDYGLVGILLKAGHILKLDHGPNCSCTPCLKRFVSGGARLQDRMRRVDLFAAASSTAFVLHQEDPLDYAMSLTKYLERCQFHDPSFALKYDDMIKKLNTVTAALIADCDQEESIGTILKRGHKPPPGPPSKTCVFGFPRASEALRCHHRQFLAQPSCNSAIFDAYCGTWNNFPSLSCLNRLSRMALHTVVYPVTALTYVFTFGRWPKSYANPCARFLTSFSSYVVFLAVLIFFTQYKEARHNLGGPPIRAKTIALGYIFAHVFGIWLVFLTDMCRIGIRRMFDVWWRKFDLVFLFAWTGTMIAYVEAVLRARHHGFYELHRVHWRPAESQLIYEIWFTWAAILSAARLFYYGQVLNELGMVMISICRCIPKVLQYVGVLFVVLCSFAIGLNHMYEHYKYNVATRGMQKVEQPFQLTSLFTMARYLYWAYYGYLPPETWRVVVGNVGHDDELEEKRHDLISFTGELMAGVYHVVELLILLNLLISIMAAAAMATADQDLVEWKVVCVEIWMEHFQDSRTIPPPFNLIHLLIHGTFYTVRKCTGTKQALSIWDFSYRFPWDEPDLESRYKDVLATLKARLLTNVESGGITLKLNEELTKSAMGGDLETAREV